MNFTIDLWVEAALNVDSTELARRIADLPPPVSLPLPDNLAFTRQFVGLPPSAPPQVVAVSLAQRSSPEWRVYAIKLISHPHSIGGATELGLDLALVGIRFCKRSYELHGPGAMNSFVFGVAQFALDAHRAYDRLERRVDQLAVVEDALEWLKSRDAEEQYIIDLRFARVEALIALGRLEEAQMGLDVEADAGTNHPLFGLLNQQISSRLISNTEIKDERSTEKQVAEQLRQSRDSAIEAFTSIAPEYAELLESPDENVVEALSPGESTAIDSREYQRLGRFMGATESDQFRLNSNIVEAWGLMADPQRGHDPELIKQAVQSLEAVWKEAVQIGLGDTAVDTWWALYIFYKRLGRYDEALGRLQSLRSWINKRRTLIRDPLKRAGFSKQHPHLYLELAARLFDRGDSAELLSAIEEAKGRALTDMLAVGAQREGVLITPESVKTWLPELMIKLNSHYVTYLIADDITYAVCVTKEGGLHSACLPIGDKHITELRANLAPSTWGKKITSLFAAPDDVAQQLSPLTNWLGELVDAGIMKEGDHVCYSPHKLLYLVPLHYVEFRGAPLVKLVSLSRTHSAALLHYFTQKEELRPTHYIAVKIPLADEAQNNPDKISKLGRVSDWLENGPLPGRRLDNEKADIAALALQNTIGAVVHFATHGYFPKPGEATDPYRGSGVIISRKGRLPQDAIHGGLLSPERVIEQGSPFKFDGSHVSLQACVSGLAEEGVGGDALGLEWALLMAGARSVLSTHWNIPVDSSADFCIHFYEDWLLNGLSRAQAWRNAVLSQMGTNSIFNGDQAYRWAAFSLAGDWR